MTREIDGPATLTASVTGGNYGEHDEKLSFSTPVIDDHVYFGLALAELQHDGYGKVVAQPGTAPSPYNTSARTSRTRMYSRAAPTSRSSGARVRNSRLIAFDTWIIPMRRAASGSTTTLAPQLGNPFDMRTDMPVEPGLRPPQRGIGDLHPELDRPARPEGRRRLYRRQSQQFINFAELNENLFRYPALSTINSPPARRS